mmetsp:Transcript_11214/g.30597  ORF Transcript_11214/g.30597 Transcript_11214/m.30597 type:complete len:226 (-) Transcript_11214:166-843(-)
MAMAFSQRSTAACTRASGHWTRSTAMARTSTLTAPPTRASGRGTQSRARVRSIGLTVRTTRASSSTVSSTVRGCTWQVLVSNTRGNSGTIDSRVRAATSLPTAACMSASGSAVTCQASARRSSPTGLVTMAGIRKTCSTVKAPSGGLRGGRTAVNGATASRRAMVSWWTATQRSAAGGFMASIRVRSRVKVWLHPDRTEDSIHPGTPEYSICHTEQVLLTPDSQH